MAARRASSTAPRRLRAPAARVALVALASWHFVGCAYLFPRRPTPPPVSAPPETPAPSATTTAPAATAATAPPGETTAPLPFNPRAGEVPDQEKPEWMRGLARPDFRDLPLRWSAKTSRFLEQYRSDTRYRDIIRGWLRRLPVYRPTMEATLVRHGLPRGLIFVAMIESGFFPGAISSKAAGGFWQFLPDVARGYGLEVSFWVDERRDPEKSTEAAALYLEDLHARFGSWELALAGYNAGFFAILTAIARFNTNDYLTLCSLEAGLPWDTTEYVPKVLAVGIVESNRAAFGFTDIAPEVPRKYETIQVPGGVPFDAIAGRLGVTADDLSQLNPIYPRRRTPPGRGPVSLRVPEGKGRALADLLANLGPGDYNVVKVRPGETLARIAKANKIARDKLKQINGVADDADIVAGTTIFVPRTKAAPAKPAAKPAAKATNKPSGKATKK